ncbi:MAG: tetratricopeptide repeat protein [Myxococcota bacterium]|jgi:tetratricopeptide (TPR) repeat protein
MTHEHSPNMRAHAARFFRRTGVLFALMVLLVIPTAPARTQETGDSLDRIARLENAISDYTEALSERDRDARLAGFARAERGFASVTEDGLDSVSLWTNLGNAAFQAGHAGHAVLAYHRALRLDPDAPTARQNLGTVRSSLPNWVPRPGATDGLLGTFDPSRVPRATRVLASSVAFFAMGLFVAVSVRHRKGAWRGLALLAGGAWAVTAFTLFAPEDEARGALAIITAEDASARSADSSLSTLALPEPLPAGVEVTLLDVREDWTRVRLANRRDVWIRSASVTPVDR